jgi:Xaa-Pro aminopeptidase
MENYNNLLNNPHELVRGLELKNRAVKELCEDYGKAAEQFGMAKADYAVAFAKKIIELKEDNQPATLIRELARGDETVARLRLDKDLWEAKMKAAKESIYAGREAINSYRSLIAWAREEKEGR